MKDSRMLPLALLLASCGGEGAGDVTAETKPAEATCDLSIATLPEKTFVWTKKDDAGAWKEDPLGRIRFSKEGDALKAKYTVASLASVYTYTCTSKDDDELECKQDSPDLLEYCRALWANVGDCTADQMAAVLGEPAVTEDMTKAVDTVKGQLKKMKPDELDKMKRAYNSPNVQLRGLLEIKVKNKADDCRLGVSDLYETFTDGSRRKLENLVGMGARFAQTEKEFLFEDCRDVASSLIAVPETDPWGKPGQTQIEGWAAGADTAHVRYVGEAHQKADKACTYSMDTFYAGEPIGKAVPVTETDSHGLKWTFDAPIRQTGTRAVTMVRYKACNGGQPEKIDVTCTPVKAK
jgi:hypothetical protein